MPRKPQVRSNGAITGTNDGSSGQPNGLPAKAAVGTGARAPYGEGTQLASAVAATPQGQGPTPEQMAEVARQHFASHDYSKTQLDQHTQRPFEPVTAGAPLDAGPTNPMAMAQVNPADQSVATILSQAASAVNSPTLRALAASVASTDNIGALG